MIYRDTTTGVNIFWSCHSSESYEALQKDFDQLYLLIKDHLPKGIVSDWKNSITACVKAYFPNIAYQRCLSHLKREACHLLPLKSPYSQTRELRNIALDVLNIFDPSDYYDWSIKLSDWLKKNESFLKEKTIGIGTKKKWWYTHGNPRRAIKILAKNQEYTFRFLKHPFLPKTNNSLEGTNSQIKAKLGNHRGMKFNQQVSFIFWWLAFNRLKNLKDLRRLWVYLKKKKAIA